MFFFPAAKAKADNATPLGLDVEEQEAPIHENVNRLVAEEGSARNVEDALAVLRYSTIVIMFTALSAWMD